MTAIQDHANRDDEESIDLRLVVRRLWAGRWVIIATTIVFTSLFAAVAFLTKPVYRASVVMIAASTEVSDMGSALNSALGQFGGLASLAGLNLGSTDSNTEEALAVLRSREFTERFIVDHQLMPKLYESLWDPAARRWKVTGNKQPTLARAYKRFDSNIRQVARDKKTGLISLRIDWRDPGEAAVWANELVRRLNAEMRNRAIVRSEASIAFLEKELASTTLVGMREAIPRLMEAQIKQRMLANVMHEYAFRIVDSAMPPDRGDRVRPNKAMLLISGVLAGSLAGAIFVLLRAAFASAPSVNRDP